jgi:hypothetical protein
MSTLILRGLLAGFIIVAVAEIAKKHQLLASLILTLPIVIPAVFLVMYLRDGDLSPISRMSRQTLLLIPLGLPFFVPLALADKLHLPFWTAFLAGLVLVTLTITLYLCFGPKSL